MSVSTETAAPPSNRRALAALLILGVALILGGGLATLNALRQAAVGPPALTPPSARDPLRAEIEAQHAALQASPDDVVGWADLGVLHVESARLGGDPTAYARAETAVDEALRLAPYGARPLRAKAVLANARHEFEVGLSAARAAVTAEPDVASPYGPLVDALLELGRYDEAATAVQTMVDLRPDLASYARVAYVRELRGDLAGATTAMEAALQAASRPADVAFARFQLGELAWQQGRLDEADTAYQTAARLDPRSLDPPAGIAKVLGARGDLAGAVSVLAPVIDRAPTPGLVVQLAELKRAAGDFAGADRLEELLDAQRRLFQANGVVLDLELAVHSADTGIGLARGLEDARDAYRSRPSVFAADALAWQLHAAGRSAEALRYADEALRLSTPRASFRWHRSEIRRSLGDVAGADQDLQATTRLNARFSPILTEAVERTATRSLSGS